MDNALEFWSHVFEDYCTATGITLTYFAPYEHSQNDLAKAFIKKLQLITRPLLLHAHLPDSFWDHAVLHAAALLRLQPSLLNTHTPFELTSGRPPNITHLESSDARPGSPSENLNVKPSALIARKVFTLVMTLPT